MATISRNNGFVQYSAQFLSNDPSVTYSGLLGRKTHGSAKHWNQNYVIICAGNIYIYKTSTSLKPCFVSPLCIFIEILLFPNRTRPPLWVFELKSSVKTISSIRFSAPSQREMNIWVNEMNTATQMSVSLQAGKPLPTVARHESFDSVSLNSSISERNEGRNNVFQRVSDPLSQSSGSGGVISRNNTLPNIEPPKDNQGNIYEDTENVVGLQTMNLLGNDDDYDEPSLQQTKETEELYEEPKEPILSEVYECSTETINIDLNNNSDTKYYLSGEDNYMFYGNREEAFKKIQQCELLGSYLVRMEDGRMVLTVKCERTIMKYKLMNHPKTDMLNINGQDFNFNNIDQLLYYYHEHNLPNQTFCLLVPYKLQH